MPIKTGLEPVSPDEKVAACASVRGLNLAGQRNLAAEVTVEVSY